jgi:DNA-nicking Smr family endonuclease
VKPLDPAQVRIAPPPEDEEVATTLRSLVLEGLTFEVIDDGATLQGRRLEVDPRVLRKLRQEHFTIDGTLDLHKHSVAEARVAVVTFVARRAREGDKVIAIVHGKGKHSHGGEPVLRGELAAWLSQGDAARHVLAFASVVDRVGESGRVVVMIR